MVERSVVQYTKEMKKLREWNSIHEAQEQYNISHISSVCRGERLSDGGFVWRYAAPDAEEFRVRKHKQEKRVAARVQEVLLGDAVEGDEDKDEEQVDIAGGSGPEGEDRVEQQ